MATSSTTHNTNTNANGNGNGQGHGMVPPLSELVPIPIKRRESRSSSRRNSLAAQSSGVSASSSSLSSVTSSSSSLLLHQKKSAASNSHTVTANTNVNVNVNANANAKTSTYTNTKTNKSKTTPRRKRQVDLRRRASLQSCPHLEALVPTYLDGNLLFSLSSSSSSSSVPRGRRYGLGRSVDDVHRLHFSSFLDHVEEETTEETFGVVNGNGGNSNNGNDDDEDDDDDDDNDWMDTQNPNPYRPLLVTVDDDKNDEDDNDDDEGVETAEAEDEESLVKTTTSSDAKVDGHANANDDSVGKKMNDRRFGELRRAERKLMNRKRRRWRFDEEPSSLSSSPVIRHGRTKLEGRHPDSHDNDPTQGQGQDEGKKASQHLERWLSVLRRSRWEYWQRQQADDDSDSNNYNNHNHSDGFRLLPLRCRWCPSPSPPEGRKPTYWGSIPSPTCVATAVDQGNDNNNDSANNSTNDSGTKNHLLRCLECSVVGCLPPSGGGNISHAVCHGVSSLSSSHGFLMDCSSRPDKHQGRGIVYCVRCAAWVNDPLVERHVLAEDVRYHLPPWYAWDDSVVERSFDLEFVDVDPYWEVGYGDDTSWHQPWILPTDTDDNGVVDVDVAHTTATATTTTTTSNGNTATTNESDHPPHSKDIHEDTPRHLHEDTSTPPGGSVLFRAVYPCEARPVLLEVAYRSLQRHWMLGGMGIGYHSSFHPLTKALSKKKNNPLISSDPRDQPHVVALASRQHERRENHRHCRFDTYPPVGLKNLGNTCYVNCVLQCLLHCESLQNFFLGHTGHDHTACARLRGVSSLSSMGGPTGSGTLTKTSKCKPDLHKKKTCIGCEMDKLYLQCLSQTLRLDVLEVLQQQRQPQPLIQQEECASVSSSQRLRNLIQISSWTSEQSFIDQYDEEKESFGKHNPSDHSHFSKTLGKPFSPNQLVAAAWADEGMSHLVESGYDQRDAHEFLHALLDSLAQSFQRTQQLATSSSVRRSNPTDPPKDHTLLPSSTNDAITSIFGGTLRNVLCCRSCGCKRLLPAEPFTVLSLPLGFSPPHNRKTTKTTTTTTSDPVVTLEQCLRRFTRSETLEDAVFCPRCRRRTPTVTQHTIADFPNVLCLHLKRFSDGSTTTNSKSSSATRTTTKKRSATGSGGGSGSGNGGGTTTPKSFHDDTQPNNKKRTDPVSFPAIGLDMGPFLPHWREVVWMTPPPPQEKDGGGGGGGGPSPDDPLSEQDDPVDEHSQHPRILYDLFGTINHTGTLHQGHYTAHVKVPTHWEEPTTNEHGDHNHPGNDPTSNHNASSTATTRSQQQRQPHSQTQSQSQSQSRAKSQWYCCNDSSVHKVPGGDNEVTSKDSAYILFYQRRRSRNRQQSLPRNHHPNDGTRRFHAHP